MLLSLRSTRSRPRHVPLATSIAVVQAPRHDRRRSTSSIRCVAQKTLMPSSATSWRMSARMPARDCDVQPDGRLVEQQQGRPVQQRAGDLDAPHLAAGKAARLVVQRVRSSRRSRSNLVDPLPRLARPHAMQRGVVGEVLVDAEVEIERARLEDDAKPPQRFAGRRG